MTTQQRNLALTSKDRLGPGGVQFFTLLGIGTFVVGFVWLLARLSKKG